MKLFLWILFDRLIRHKYVIFFILNYSLGADVWQNKLNVRPKYRALVKTSYIKASFVQFVHTLQIMLDNLTPMSQTLTPCWSRLPMYKKSESRRQINISCTVNLMGCDVIFFRSSGPIYPWTNKCCCISFAMEWEQNVQIKFHWTVSSQRLPLSNVISNRQALSRILSGTIQIVG